MRIPSLSALILTTRCDTVANPVCRYTNCCNRIGHKHNATRRQAVATCFGQSTRRPHEISQQTRCIPILRTLPAATFRMYDGHDYRRLLPRPLAGHHRNRAFRAWGFGPSRRQYHRRDPL
ncbi:hypothetical protein BJY52DRAFT_521963 [Lactarius psammicola]|nr:hypothetical protein BJY52DRAFT_521963 [Lactarius psammicola]